MFNLRYWTRYLQHRFAGKTRHGTHSPFVYRLVDEVIYDFSKKIVYQDTEQNLKRHSAEKNISPRLARLIYRLVAERQPERIVILGEDQNIAPYLWAAAPNAKIYNQKDHTAEAALDFAFINTRSYVDAKHFFYWCLDKVNSSTMLIYNGIYRTKGTEKAWAEIKTQPQVTVTVDLFWIGLVFFKKGQAKEDFKIRF